jgi:hypothetical protein
MKELVPGILYGYRVTATGKKVSLTAAKQWSDEERRLAKKIAKRKARQKGQNRGGR